LFSVNRKLDWKAEAKIPKATEAANHKAGGGNVEIIDRKVEWKAEAKIPKATEAANHKAGGGNVKLHGVKSPNSASRGNSKPGSAVSSRRSTAVLDPEIKASLATTAGSVNGSDS